MGLLIDGEWHDAWYDTKESRGPLRAHRGAVSQLGHTRRQRGPERPRRIPRGAEPLPPLRRVRVPMGAPHADFPQAQGTSSR